MSDVVVVGGGIAGLVIARKLLIEGRSVTLLEAGDRLGGSVSRHVVGGITLDAGAESYATRGGTVEALVRDLGLGDEIVAPNPTGAWLQPAAGSAVPIPATSLLGIPGSPVAEDVIAVLGQTAALRAFAVDAFLPGTVGSKATTLGELVRRRMGDDVLDRLVAPIVNGVHSASPDDLDLDRVAPQLRAALRREGSLARAVRSLRAEAPAGTAVAGLRGGISRIVDELVADLERFGADIRLNTPVRSVTVGSATTDDDVLGGHIVVAASGVLGPLATPDRVVTLATLVVEQPLLDAAPRGTGLLVANGAKGIRARALTHATAKWSWLAERADGRHVLRLSYSEDPADLAEIARVDAAALLGVPIDAAAVVDFARVQWTRTTAVETAPDGVTLVGEGIAGTGLANIIGHSQAQADSVVRGELQ
ncbi:protoporphyrinogen/coproporphyrinogen oxidase [Conyzicola sp.]|uniref:protoporphyrinogen/coproporphyrinogen oxidase n=1 Tax=Conyzicola sp. TaxID=1969404 RepID=UPI003989AFD7